MTHSTNPFYGLPVKEIARICRVSEKTAARWKAGQSVPPQTALMILSRDLGIFAPEWRGWTINCEDLVSPDGWCVSRGDALTVPLVHAQIAELRRQVRELKEAPYDLEDQPADWEIPTIRTG